MDLSRFSLLSVGLLTGCASSAVFSNARTLGAGNFEGVVEPQYIGGAVGEEAFGVPTLAVSGRYGVSDKVDLGARLGGSGLTLLSKFRLLDAQESGFDLTLAPSVGGLYLGAADAGGVGFGTASLPLLFGINTGPRNQLVVGPSSNLLLLGGGEGGDSAVAGVLGVGGNLGYQLWIGEGFAIQPELAVTAPVLAFAGATGLGSGAAAGFGGVGFQFGVGAQFGTPGRN